MPFALSFALDWRSHRNHQQVTDHALDPLPIMALSAKCSCFVSHRPLEAPSLLREVNDLAQSLIDLQTAEVKKMCVEARKTPDMYATVFCLVLGRLQLDYFFTKSGHIFCEGRC